MTEVLPFVGDIPIKTTKAFSLEGRDCHGWQIAREDQRSKELIRCLPYERLAFDYGEWRDGDSPYVRLDDRIFQSIANHLKSRDWLPHQEHAISDTLIRHRPPGQPFFQFNVDGTIFRNEHGVLCCFFFRLAHDWDQMPKIWWRWGWTPVEKDWGFPVPALVMHAYGL